jgi:hypothetical protein
MSRQRSDECLGLFEKPRLAAGRQVRVLERGVRRAGRHAVIRDGTDSARRRVSAGVYFVRMKAEAGEVSRRVVVLR